jgi:hypothetical protein
MRVSDSLTQNQHPSLNNTPARAKHRIAPRQARQPRDHWKYFESACVDLHPLCVFAGGNPMKHRGRESPREPFETGRPDMSLLRSAMSKRDLKNRPNGISNLILTVKLERAQAIQFE